MKVAIIGAGLSGLACAHEFKRHGIIPTIFEQKSYIGEVLELPAIVLNMFSSKKDQLKYLKEKFKIDLSPHYDLKQIIMVSPSNTYSVEGSMGSIFLRGWQHEYLTRHLARLVDLPVTLGTYGDVNNLKNEYDYVVVSDGTSEVANSMKLMNVHFDGYVRIATILGDFDTSSVIVWLNTNYAKHGYAYLVAESEKVARLVLIVDNIKQNELDFYWSQFLKIENIPYRIIETKELRHTVGSVFPLQIENIYLVGNAGGFLDGMLGFGAMNAIISGARAAESIVKGHDYNDAMQDIIKDINKKYEFRKVFNTFDNKGMDLMVAMENLPLIKQFIFNNPLLKVTYGTFLAKAYNMIKDK